jgi:hypothetical protein
MKTKEIIFGVLLFCFLISLLIITIPNTQTLSCTYPNGLIPQYTKFMFDNNNKLNDLQKAQMSLSVGYQYATCK